MYYQNMQTFEDYKQVTNYEIFIWLTKMINPYKVN